MSVLKNKRGLSDLEFYNNAVDLRKEIALLLLRDFGVKDKIREVKASTLGMTDDDAKIYSALIEKYHNTHILEKCPLWMIDRLRNNFMNITHYLIMNITQANSIYPVCESEFYDRRNYQNHAIGNCEQLMQEMMFVISIIPVDANKYMRYVDMIEKEIALLKGWRKSDNKILKRIQEGKKEESDGDSSGKKSVESKNTSKQNTGKFNNVGRKPTGKSGSHTK